MLWDSPSGWMLSFLSVGDRRGVCVKWNHLPSRCLTLQCIWIQNILKTDAVKIQSARQAYDAWDEGGFYTALFAASEDFILWNNVPFVKFWLDEGHGFVCFVRNERVPKKGWARRCLRLIRLKTLTIFWDPIPLKPSMPVLLLENVGWPPQLRLSNSLLDHWSIRINWLLWEKYQWWALRNFTDFELLNSLYIVTSEWNCQVVWIGL